MISNNMDIYNIHKQNYIILKEQLGGVFQNVPKFIQGSENKGEPDNLRTLTTSINVTDPYKAHEYGQHTIRKKDLFNNKKIYAEFPDFDSHKAYDNEPENMNPVYCARRPIYPLKGLNHIRIVSYNVHNWVKQCNDYNVDIRLRPSGTYSIGRNEIPSLETIFNLLPDIIFLQEIVPIYRKKPKTDNEIESGNFVDLVQKFANMGYIYNFIGDTHYSTMETAKDMKFPYYMLCNAIFSKYKIVESKSVELENNRIVIVCVIELPNNRYVACYNVHIEFDDREVDEKRDIKYKQAQINNLAKIIYDDSVSFDNKYPGISYVLGGDFNNTYDDDRIGNLENNINTWGINFTPIVDMLTYIKPRLSVKSDDNGQIFTAQNTRRIIDHFFVSPNLKVKNNETLIVPDNHSDHYPVLIDLII